MKTQFNSSAVRNEVMNMETEAVKNTAKEHKGTILFIVYVTSAIAVIALLNSLGLIPA